MKHKPIVHVVDFFAGCGGTSAGLRDAGMKIIAGIDNDRDAAQSYRLNFPGAKVFEQDISTISADEIEKIMPRTEPVLFAGCAPCQPFSKHQSNRSLKDPRRALLLEFLGLVSELRPEFILIENVPGMQNLKSRSGPFNTFVRTLKAESYAVKFGVVRAADYGVPQIRKRLILLASRVCDVDLPKPTHGQGLLPYSTVRDWIYNLPPVSAGEADGSDPDHVTMKLSDINMRRIRATAEGAGRSEWPAELKLNCHADHAGHSDVYGRLAWNRPASGLTTKCISYSNGRFGHPTQNRAITIREAALLQTFSLDFKLAGNMTSRARQIGNAVPPLVAKRVGEQLLNNFVPSRI